MAASSSSGKKTRRPLFPPPTPGITTGGGVGDMEKEVRWALWDTFWQLPPDQQAQAFITRPLLPKWIYNNYEGPHNVIRVNNEFVTCTLTIEHPNAFPTDVDPYTTIEHWFTTQPNAQQAIGEKSYYVYEFTVGDSENFKEWKYEPSGKSFVQEKSEQYKYAAPAEYNEAITSMGIPTAPMRGDMETQQAPGGLGHQLLSFSGDSSGAIRSRGPSPEGVFMPASSSSGSGGVRSGLQSGVRDFSGSGNSFEPLSTGGIGQEPTPPGEALFPNRGLFVSGSSGSGGSGGLQGYGMESLQGQQQPAGAAFMGGQLNFSSESGGSVPNISPASGSLSQGAPISGGAEISQQPPPQQPTSAALGGLRFSSDSSGGASGRVNGGPTGSIPGHVASLTVGSGQSSNGSDVLSGFAALSGSSGQPDTPQVETGAALMALSFSSSQSSQGSPLGVPSAIASGSSAEQLPTASVNPGTAPMALNFSTSDGSQGSLLGVPAEMASGSSAEQQPTASANPVPSARRVTFSSSVLSQERPVGSPPEMGSSGSSVEQQQQPTARQDPMPIARALNFSDSSGAASDLSPAAGSSIPGRVESLTVGAQADASQSVYSGSSGGTGATPMVPNQPISRNLFSGSSVEGGSGGDERSLGGSGRGAIGGGGRGGLNFDSSGSSPAPLPSAEKFRHESDHFGRLAHLGGLGDQFQNQLGDDDVFEYDGQSNFELGYGASRFERAAGQQKQNQAPRIDQQLQRLAEEQALAVAQRGAEGLSLDQGSPPSPQSMERAPLRNLRRLLFAEDNITTQFRPSEGPMEGELAEDVRRAANLEYNINKFSEPMRKLRPGETLGPFGGKYAPVGGGGYGREEMGVIDRWRDLVWQDYPGFTDQNFVSITKLGSGYFGDVRLVRGKTDGLYYALKEGKVPMNHMSLVLQKKQLNEIHALSILKESYYIIKYCNSWCDKMNIYIQLEFCNAGTMTSLIQSKMKRKEPVTEGELKTQLLHIGLGLQYMHALGIAHMDIKPDNIFIHVKGELPSVDYFFAQMATSQAEGPYTAEQCLERGGLPVYKIGDLGLATQASKRVRDLNDDELGDRNYLSPEMWELINGSDSPAADASPACSDMYALGESVLEAATCLMPECRIATHDGKNVKVNLLGMLIENPRLLKPLQLSGDLEQTLIGLVSRDPFRRPTAQQLVSLPMLNASVRTTGQMQRKWNTAKEENEVLEAEIQYLRAINRQKSQMMSRDPSQSPDPRHYKYRALQPTLMSKTRRLVSDRI